MRQGWQRQPATYGQIEASGGRATLGAPANGLAETARK